MKKNFSIIKWIIIALFIVAVIISFKVFEKLTFCTSIHSNQVVTIWNRYIIFEKYEGLLPPKDNYIKIRKNKDLHYNVFFKSDNTVTIWSASNKTIKARFDKKGYDIKIYYGYDNAHPFYNDCQYSDLLAVAEYEYYYEHIRDLSWKHLKINEILNDSVISFKYEITPWGSISRKLKCIYPRDHEIFDR